jgi:hypothetical protein
MNFKKGFYNIAFFVLFVFLLSQLGACTQNKPKPNENNTDLPVFQTGEAVIIPKTLELVLQNISISPFIPIQDQESSYETLPHVYFNRDHFSIVRYEKDGNSIFTSIEKENSPNYEVGYIVEKNTSTKHTNAPYALDPSESKLYPIDPQNSFLIARLSIVNPGNKPFDLNNLDLKLEMEDQSILLFDKLLSDTILINPPNMILKPKESTIIQILALVPSGTKHCYIQAYERKIEWKEE